MQPIVNPALTAINCIGILAEINKRNKVQRQKLTCIEPLSVLFPIMPAYLIVRCVLHDGKDGTKLLLVHNAGTVRDIGHDGQWEGEPRRAAVRLATTNHCMCVTMEKSSMFRENGPRNSAVSALSQYAVTHLVFYPVGNIKYFQQLL